MVILQLLQNFLKKEYNNNFKVKYILMFLILLYVYNFFSIIISLLFKTALNPNKFFNLNNGSLSFLTSKNDSLLKNSIYNDNTRSEWVGLQFEQLTNNYNKFIYFFFINLFFFLLFTSIFIFTILLNVLFYYNKKNSKQTLLNLYIYINESFVYFNIIYLLNVNNIVNILQILCF